MHKEIKIKGLETIKNKIGTSANLKQLHCLLEIDEYGKTLSIHNEKIMFSIPLEPILEILRK